MKYTKADMLDLGLLKVTRQKLQSLDPITTTAIFISSSTNFAPEGLYSNEIFGPQGSEDRSTIFSYIDLQVPHIHPMVYNGLTSASQLYSNIIAGTVSAIWDKKLKQFVKDETGMGSTGYSFFISHIDELQIDDTGSESRRNLIQLLKRYKGFLTIPVMMVIPAGIRDYSVDAAGRATEDEINSFYKRLISAAALIPPGIGSDDASLDTTRFNIQKVIQELAEYIYDILLGKSKFVNKKWSARRVHGGTKNVITAMQQPIQDLRSPARLSHNDSVAGLFQTCKAATILVSHGVREGFLSRVFPGEGGFMHMTDKETLKHVQVDFDVTMYNNLMTYEGLNKVLNKYRDKSVRDIPIEYNGNWLAMVYEDDNDGVMIFQDVSELPPGYNQKGIRPVTLTDVFYHAAARHIDKLPCTVTRYPVVAIGGVYPSRVYLKATIDTVVKYQIDSQGHRTNFIYRTYPVVKSGFYSSFSVNHTHLQLLAADFDGDAMSLIVLQSTEAIEEINTFFKSASSYISSSGKLLYNPGNSVVDLVISSITA